MLELLWLRVSKKCDASVFWPGWPGQELKAMSCGFCWAGTVSVLATPSQQSRLAVFFF